MYCLRCGREKPEKQVFCDACLDDMSRHPVKPDATVYIPTRKPNDSGKKHARHTKRKISPEEMILILKKRIKRLWIAVLILVLLLGICGAGIYFAWHHNPDLIIGQNYHTIDQAGTSDTTAIAGSTGG